MSKKPARERPANQLVNFRPGAGLDAWLVNAADSWGVSVGEASKRCTILCATGMTLDFYPYVARLANLFNQNRADGFLETARQCNKLLTGRIKGSNRAPAISELISLLREIITEKEAEEAAKLEAKQKELAKA